LVGRKVSKARLINDIYETACASVALPVDEDSVSIAMFRMVIAQARNLIRQRDEIERTAHAMLCRATFRVRKRDKQDENPAFRNWRRA